MNNNRIIKDLTLLLLWLTSWEENDLIRSWKGYDFSILDELKKEGLIDSSYRAKSCHLTKDGITRAKEIKKKYKNN